MLTQQTLHPMVKLQQKLSSLINSKIVKPTDSISKIALLYGNEWSYWKSELHSFGFSMQDSIAEIVEVEAWDEE